MSTSETKKSVRGGTARYRSKRREMPFIEHLREVRRLLIISICSVFVTSIVCFVFYDAILSILLRPFESVVENGNAETLYVNTLLEGFFNKIKICFLSGLIISLPVHTYNVLYFIFPGLNGKERRIITISLVVSFALLLFAG